MKKIFALNLGSSSTKVAYAVDNQIVYKESIYYSNEELADCNTFFDQEPIRFKSILENMRAHGVDINELDAIIARGGMLQPLPVGVFKVNEDMVDQVLSEEYGSHPSSMGIKIALDLVNGTDALALTADVPSSDELLPIARYTGLKEISRRTMTQTLNARAVLREWCAANGKRYEDINAITIGLGGGMNSIAHCHGRMIDTNDSVTGEGCFSSNRALTVPIGELIKECYSGEYTYEEMLWHVNGDAGLQCYLGTADMREILERINQGDTYAEEVVDAMCYQAAKDIGAFATTMFGDVDVIAIMGGMANCDFVSQRLAKRVEWIAPVYIRPGELELEALLDNGFQALDGEIPIQEFSAAANVDEAIERINEFWVDKDWTYER